MEEEDVALINGWDITHILFRHKEDVLIAVYQNENVRIYDAFFIKNKEHPEMIRTLGRNCSINIFTRFIIFLPTGCADPNAGYVER